MGKVTRRAAIVGAVASTAALAIPISAVAKAERETAIGRVRRLQKELSLALAQLNAEPGRPNYVSIVFAEGAARHACTLYDRDLYHGEATEVARAINLPKFAPPVPVGSAR